MSQLTKFAEGTHLRRIRLELARAKGHPEGSAGDGYEFVAPIDKRGQIDLDAWKSERALCFVHRIEGGHVTARGLLLHRAAGAGGASWVFEYDPGAAADADSGYRFGSHAFTPGEYVSIRDEDGDLRTYRVASVNPA